MRMHLNVCGVYHQPFEIRINHKLFQQLLPDSLVPPTAEPAMCVLPVPVIGRQIPPGSTGTQNPEHRVDEETIVPGFPAPGTLTARKKRFQQPPDPVRNIVPSVPLVHSDFPLTE